MANQNFMRQLLSGLQSSYQQAAANTYERIQREDAFNREQKAKQVEINKQAFKNSLLRQKEQEELPVIKSLLTGNLPKEEQISAYLKLSPTGRKFFQEAKTNLLPKVSTKIVDGSLYQVVDGQVQPEPLVKRAPKVIGQIWGENKDTGDYGYTVIFDNGEQEFFDPGVEPKASNKSSSKQTPLYIKDFNPTKYSSTMDKFTTRLNQMEGLRAKYNEANFAGIDLTGETTALKMQLNNIAETQEKSLYGLLAPKDTRIYADKAIADLERLAKELGKKSVDELVAENPEAYLEAFKMDLTDLYNEGKINNLQLQSLALWAKFKFGKIYN